MPLKRCPWMGLRDPLPATPRAAGATAGLDWGQNFAVTSGYLISCLGLWTRLSVFVISLPSQGTCFLSC